MTYIALRTLQAIDNAIAADGGATFRRNEGQVLPHIGDAYRDEEEGPRSHLGASILGRECAREIYYSWHWASKPSFNGRMYRLFNRGHLEEGRFIAALLTIGCLVYQQDENGKQFRISFAEGHGGGSGDGVVLNVPDVEPGLPVLGEFKTHGETSFIDLAGKLTEWRAHVEDPSKNRFTGKGVRESKWEHFVQMQTYMRKMGLAAALYMAVNKNTDDLYAEIVQLDTEIADSYLDRGEKLVYTTTPPARINKSPGYYKCRFCDERPVCHLKAAPQMNCRTCKHSYPDPQSPSGSPQWVCGKFKKPLDYAAQIAGCPSHEVQEDF